MSDPVVLTRSSSSNTLAQPSRALPSQFHINIVVERPDGREIAKPVELRVMVGDANDNRPTFPQAQYHTVVKELAARGTTQHHVPAD